MRGLLATLSILLLACACPAMGQPLSLTTDNIYPRATPDGTGFEDIILQEAFRRIGLDIRTTFLPSERAMINADEGVDDGTYSRVKGLDAKFTNLVMVPAEVSIFSFTAFTKNPEIRIQQWADLAGLNVAIVNGWQLPAQRIAGARSLHKVREDKTLFQLLAQDRADVVVHELVGGKMLIREMGLSGMIAQIPPLENTSMYLYLNRRHAALVSPLTEVLRMMDAEGRRKEIIARVLKEAGLQ